MSDIRLRHWTSEILHLFAKWLWKKEHYGHALLVFHGPIWGLKIGQQLAVTWYDIFDEDGLMRLEFISKSSKNAYRELDAESGIMKATRKLYDIMHEQKIFDNYFIDDSIYVNWKTKKPITSSTLNRELARFEKEFRDELRAEYGELKLKPLKSNALQIAWALDTLIDYGFSKRVFGEVSRYMGHNSVADTIKLLEVEIHNDIDFNFNRYYEVGIDETDVLEYSWLLRSAVKRANWE